MASNETGKKRKREQEDFGYGLCDRPRQTPSGTQCESAHHEHWTGRRSGFTARGRWLQGPIPRHCISCGPYSRCHTSRHAKITVPSKQDLTALPGAGGVHPSFDIAERVEHSDNVPQSTTRCMITELPCEIFRQIIDYIISH